MSNQTADYLLPVLCQIIIGISSVTDRPTPLTEALYALTRTTFLFNIQNIRLIIDAGTLPCITKLLIHTNESVQIYSLQVLSDIVCSSSENTQEVLDCNILEHFPMLLTHENKEIKKMVTSCLINMTSGLSEHERAVMNSDVPTALVTAIMNEEPEIGKSIIDVFYNLLVGASADDVEKLVLYGITEAFLKLLLSNKDDDSANVSTILDYPKPKAVRKIDIVLAIEFQA